MPLYSYRCDAGHTFDQLVKMNGSDAPVTCPCIDEEVSQRLHVETVCGERVEKQLSLNAKSFPGADSWRK